MQNSVNCRKPTAKALNPNLGFDKASKQPKAACTGAQRRSVAGARYEGRPPKPCTLNPKPKAEVCNVRVSFVVTLSQAQLDPVPQSDHATIRPQTGRLREGSPFKSASKPKAPECPMLSRQATTRHSFQYSFSIFLIKFQVARVCNPQSYSSNLRPPNLLRWKVCDACDMELAGRAAASTVPRHSECKLVLLVDQGKHVQNSATELETRSSTCYYFSVAFISM